MNEKTEGKGEKKKVEWKSDEKLTMVIKKSLDWKPDEKLTIPFQESASKKKDKDAKE